jgi:hypothetical protein
MRGREVHSNLRKSIAYHFLVFQKVRVSLDRSFQHTEYLVCREHGGCGN